jgi:hypothetical protein
MRGSRSWLWPISLRWIARLIGRCALEDEVSDKVIEECAYSVLAGSIRTFEGDLGGS